MNSIEQTFDKHQDVKDGLEFSLSKLWSDSRIKVVCQKNTLHPYVVFGSVMV